MKLFLLSAFLIMLTQLIQGQTATEYKVTTEPEFFTANEEVKVQFELINFNTSDNWGDVYLWIWLKDPDIGNADGLGKWDDSSENFKMTTERANVYSYTFTPSQLWAGVDASSIKKIGVIAKAKNGSNTGSGDKKTSPDYFLDVTNAGELVVNASLQSPYIADANSSVDVTVSSNKTATLSLLLNNDIIHSSTGTTLNTTVVFPPSGDHWLIAKADSSGITSYDSVFVTVKPGVLPAQPIPEGYRKGINYPDATTAGLVLYAPGKEYVYVIGDFNNWLPKSSSIMKKDGDNFWVNIEGLTPGQEYIFQYLIDGELKIADPYTEKIIDPWNDKSIPGDVYPGLIPYPTGKTEGITSVLQTDQQPFNWTVTDFKPPAPDTMAIYELLVRDFVKKHSYERVKAKLDYLQLLNINVLELMPVNEFEGNSSWGYNPSFYFAPDKYYGTKNALKELIDECHNRGIAVVIDMVLNHSYGQSPFVMMYFENDKPSPQNPWYNVDSNFENPDAQWGYDFDHESPATQELVDSVCSFWMSEYKVDGFRFDFTKGFSNNIKGSDDPWGSKYDADRIRLLKRMADEIWKRNSDAIIIFEHLSENREEKELANHGNGILMWGNINHNSAEAAMGYTEDNKSDLSWASYKKRGWSKPHLVGYMESHDEERIAFKCQEYGNSRPGYDIKQKKTTLKRIALTSSIFLTIPGPKMIWQFGELGYDISIEEGGRTAPKPVLWEYYEDSDRKRLYDIFSAVIKLKKSQPIFSTSDFSCSLNERIKSITLKHNGEHVVAIGNFGISPEDVTVSFPKDGTWYEWFNDNKTINVSGASKQLSLNAGKFSLYSTQMFPGAITPTPRDQLKQEDGKGPLLWPNPATESFNVSTSYPVTQIKIYSVDGRMVYMQGFDEQNTTITDVPIKNLLKGIYTVKIYTKNGQPKNSKLIKN